jgi:amino acid permease
LSLAIFITVFLVLILAFNLMPVIVYGETEFFFGMLKTLLIIGLILAGFFINWGANPKNEYIGGRYWDTYVTLEDFASISSYVPSFANGLIGPSRNTSSKATPVASSPSGAP